MTRVTIKNRINKILREKTAGHFNDTGWVPVNTSFSAIREAGFDLNLTGTKYDKDAAGNPCSKTWTFEIDMGSKKPIFGICTAHGAGEIGNPLSSYDISAYVS